MSVYSIDAAPQNYAYDVEGNGLEQAYNIEANPLLSKEPLPFSVMSYNVQYFTRINSQIAMQQKILSDNVPSIIGLQEFSTTPATPTVGQTVLSGFQTIVNSNSAIALSGLGVASKVPIFDTTIYKYLAQDPDDMTQYGVERGLIKTYFRFNGKKICFINTHLSVIHMSPIYAQMAELFAIARQEKYVIITGDFNTVFNDFDNVIYNNTFKQFVDAGYKLVNNSPTSGITKTYSSSTTVTSLEDFTSNPDSIIVSNNIGIDSRNFDTTKLQYLDGNPIDHIAVVATLLI